MLAQPVSVINNWTRDYQAVGYGNYGYGIYSQDVEVHRNPYTGRVNIERDVDFIPLGYQSFGGCRVPVHQHFHY